MISVEVGVMGDIRGNIFGGITAAIVALPLGLAFGVASGLGPAAGIYGAIILGFFAALLGGTPTQISGPTGPMTVVVAAAVVTLHQDIHLIATVVLLAGLLQILFGFFHIGKFVRYIPYPVISGFMSGIGIIIIILQINPFLGLQSDASILHILASLPSNLSHINPWSFFLATISLLVVLLTPTKVTKIIPAPLIVLGVMTPLSVAFGLPVETIGAIPSSLPNIVIPAAFTLDNYKMILSIALTLAVLGTIDTLLTSIVADSITRTKHNPNKELFGQGIGNALCGMVGAVPGAGATMRTVINIKSGGTSKLSGVTHAIVLLTVVLFLAPFASQIPLALLSGILIKVGIDILDYRFLRDWKNSPKYDLSVMITVFIVTVFVDLITAVGLGIILASLLIVYRITKETKIVLTCEEKGGDYDIDFNQKKIRIIKINGAFFFGSSNAFENAIDEILDTKTIIVDIVDVPFVDLTAIFTLQDMIMKFQDETMEIIIIAKALHQEKILKLNKTGVFDSVKFYNNFDDAVAIYKEER